MQCFHRSPKWDSIPWMCNPHWIWAKRALTPISKLKTRVVRRWELGGRGRDVWVVCVPLEKDNQSITCPLNRQRVCVTAILRFSDILRSRQEFGRCFTIVSSAQSYLSCWNHFLEIWGMPNHACLKLDMSRKFQTFRNSVFYFLKG